MRNQILLIAILATTFCISSCNKTKSDIPTGFLSSIETGSNQNNSMKWGKNEEIYKADLIRISNNLKKTYSDKIIEPEPEPMPNPLPSYTCSASGGSTYGYYQDPENLIFGGPYNSASTSGQESFFKTCSNVTSAIISARNYLINEGYSDIVSQIDSQGESFKLIHAANSLMDLKVQVGLSGNNQTTKVANCIFQALGYTALAELGANWAGASRQVILRAVGKVATRYLGWFGAAIAITSFVDCMWG